MLDKEMLSKQKYIYCVYSGKDDCLNVERFPIIYINNRYVYYKKPGSETLDYKSISFVKDSLNSLKDYEINHLRFQRELFWNVDENIPETLDSLKKKYKDMKIKREKAEAKEQLDISKRIYEEALARYEKKYGRE